MQGSILHGSPTDAQCGAKTRSGEPCRNRPMTAGRCRMHGGASRFWFAHPNYKHGRYSKYSLEGRRLQAERKARKRQREQRKAFLKAAPEIFERLCRQLGFTPD